MKPEKKDKPKHDAPMIDPITGQVVPRYIPGEVAPGLSEEEARRLGINTGQDGEAITEFDRIILRWYGRRA